MKLSAPKVVIWWIAVILGVLGIVANFVNIPFVSANKYWFEVAAFGLMFLGTLFKGL